jgi:protein gp37
MRMAARLDAMGMKKYRGLTRKSGKRAVWTGRVRLDRNALDIPAGWKKPRRIFVNSMSDLFHEAVPAEFVAAVWRAMQATPQHTYQILTKRPDRMAEITASLPCCRTCRSGQVSRAPTISGALMICARSMLPSGSFRSNRCSGRWFGPI